MSSIGYRPNMTVHLLNELLYFSDGQDFYQALISGCFGLDLAAW